jgi:hypothetical protein
MVQLYHFAERQGALKIMPLPPVIRHLTHLPRAGAQSKLVTRTCQLKPKAEIDGKAPGMFSNLFVTRLNPPPAGALDESETYIGSRCLVAKGGINFRYVGR